MDSPYLSIVVPCYNESANLARGVLQEMQDYLAAQPWSYEVIISDDGSADDSLTRVRAFAVEHPAFRAVENPHGGKPSAVWGGIRAARGQLILFTDMDQSTPLSELDNLLPLFEQGYDVVIGSRGLGRENFPFYRRLGSAVFAGFRRLMLLRNIRDTQCGFKAMRTEIAKQLFPHLTEIKRTSQVKGRRVTAFDVELLFLAEFAGYRVGEVAVNWVNRDVVKGGISTYFRESGEMAGQIFHIKWKQLCGDYTEVRGMAHS